MAHALIFSCGSTGPIYLDDYGRKRKQILIKPTAWRWQVTDRLLNAGIGKKKKEEEKEEEEKKRRRVKTTINKQPQEQEENRDEVI